MNCEAEKVAASTDTVEASSAARLEIVPPTDCSVSEPPLVTPIDSSTWIPEITTLPSIDMLSTSSNDELASAPCTAKDAEAATSITPPLPATRVVPAGTTNT